MTDAAINEANVRLNARAEALVGALEEAKSCAEAIVTLLDEGRPAQARGIAVGLGSYCHRALSDPPEQQERQESGREEVERLAKEQVTDAMVERAAREAFWTDDIGGHHKRGPTPHTWENIPEQGRENYRTMIRAALRAALDRERSVEGEQVTVSLSREEVEAIPVLLEAAEHYDTRLPAAQGSVAQHTLVAKLRDALDRGRSVEGEQGDG